MPNVATILMTCVLLAGLSQAQTTRPSADSRFLPEPGFFKTLVNPQCSHCNIEAQRRATELRVDDPVLAWTRGKYDGGAVPLRFFLAPYRVISDSYGVWVYDADAGFVRGYEPSYDFTFAGWRNGVMVIRHKDGTLFSALSGVAFDGPRKGQRLKPLATIQTTWGYWLKAYPHTVAYNMFEKYRPVALPTAETAQSVGTRLPSDPRLPAATEVVGLWLNDHPRAYPTAELEKTGGLLTDIVAGHPVVVFWHPSTRAAAAYAPEVDDAQVRHKLTFHLDRDRPMSPFVDAETGSHWGIEGRAVDGPLKGKTLRWLDSVKCKWFAWAAEYPLTTVHSFAAPAGEDDVHPR